MKGMASAKESRPVPPNGRYPFNITAAEAGFTNVKNEGKPNQTGGDSCLKLSLEVAEGEFAGYPAFDTLGTDGTTNFGGMSKKRLRQLEVPGLDSDAEVPDEVIAQSLLNKRVFAEVERTPIEKKNEATGKWEPQYDVDEKTGVKVVRYKLQILGYLRQPTTGAQLTQQTQQLQQAPQVAQTQQLQPTLPPGFAPPAAQWPGQVPGGFAPPAPGAVPGGYAVAAPGGYPQMQAPANWNAAPNGVPGAAPVGVPGQLPFPGAPGAPQTR